MLTLQNLSYLHSNKDLLFDNLNLTVKSRDKMGLIGNNGVGKSTLFKIISGELTPSSGGLTAAAEPYYIPQIFGQYNHLSIAEALRVSDKMEALSEIVKGNVTEQNLNLLAEDWTVEERSREALDSWQLPYTDLSQKMGTLSGGQKTRVFLAGISIHRPEIVLLDEPSNHLDGRGRKLLYDFVRSFSSTLMVVSHDRKLLNLMDFIGELGRMGITVYGGNYDFYAAQKQIEINALDEDLKEKNRALHKAREKERETLERQRRSDARGKRKQQKAGLPTISMNTFKNNAEKSTAKVKDVHREKIAGLSEEMRELRSRLAGIDKMKLDFDNSTLHKGKILFSAQDINFGYNDQMLWRVHLSFLVTSGERIWLKGLNGSGKTSLIKIILGRLEPKIGSVYRADNQSVYIDQDYSLIENRLTVFEQALKFNVTGLQEHEIKIRLNRFLFLPEDWDKSCKRLSGGEKMRLMLCCLTIAHCSADIIVLDEPTNNLDIQNIEILTAAIREYQGTLVVVSHDEYFLEEIGVTRVISL